MTLLAVRLIFLLGLIALQLLKLKRTQTFKIIAEKDNKTELSTANETFFINVLKSDCTL